MTIARRTLLMTTLISGFSLATVRGYAAAIHTDDTGLVDGAAMIPVADGMLPAYFARPKGVGPFPRGLPAQLNAAAAQDGWHQELGWFKQSGV